MSVEHGVYDIRTCAWHGDLVSHIKLPNTWNVSIIKPSLNTPLDAEAIEHAVTHPLSGAGISCLSKGKKKAVIIIDDMTRPTPCEKILPCVIKELIKGGISEYDISIIIATGTHTPPDQEELVKKIGKAVPTSIVVLAHNAKEDVILIGTSPKGIDIYANRQVIESDIKIGIGVVYPHPAAGYSGGAKIAAPGILGFSTIQEMHDLLYGAGRRGKDLNSELRNEIDAIGEMIGLDYVIDVLLDENRHIGFLAAGDSKTVMDSAIKEFKRSCGISTFKKADIIIMNAYPFDGTFTFSLQRGLWPLWESKKAVGVLIAASPEGMGFHELYPMKHSISQRIKRYFAKLTWSTIKALPRKAVVLIKLMKQSRRHFYVVSEGINEKDVKSCYKNAQHRPSWNEMLVELEMLFKDREIVNVTLLSAAPLVEVTEKK